jgi:hypothetical protein
MIWECLLSKESSGITLQALSFHSESMSQTKHHNFSSQKIPDLSVPFDIDYTYYFGEGTDREAQTIRYEANEKSKLTLPSFMTFEAS